MRRLGPTDTTFAPLASPTLTGTPTAPTAAAGTATTQIASTAFVGAATENISTSTVLATGGSTARTEAARAADFITIRDFSAAMDGATDDTAALNAAIAAASGRAVVLPFGAAKVTPRIVDLTGRFVGPGQIMTGRATVAAGTSVAGDGKKRAPNFARRVTPPTAYSTTIDDAFNGDASTIHLGIEHRIDGAATLGTPATGYFMNHETAAASIWYANNSGNNLSTAGNGGRTGTAAISGNLSHSGNGDTYFMTVNGFISGTRAGSTHFLANPGILAIGGGFFSFADGTYQEFDEFTHDDSGFGGTGYDIAVSSTVRNFNRSNDTGAKGAWWLGFRLQSLGAKAVDVGFQLVGKWRNGLDTTGIVGTAGPVASLRAGQRVHWNSTAETSGVYNPRGTVFGTEYTHYNPVTSAWEVVVGGTAVLSVTASAVKGLAPAVGSNDTTLATTAFVGAAVGAVSGSVYLNSTLQSGTAGAMPRTDIYTTAGAFTWTKLAGAAMVDVVLIGAGGGGGAGGVVASGTAASGGAGGGSGARVAMTVPATVLAGTVSGSVGTAGAGGSGSSSTGTGASGSGSASASTFGGLSSYGGNGGGGGATATALGGAGGGANGTNGGAALGAYAGSAPTALGGGSGGTISGIGVVGSAGRNGDLGGPASGASGGGVTTAPAFNAGALGGVVPGVTVAVGGTTQGASGAAAKAPLFDWSVGASGGSGASSAAGTSGGSAGAGSGYGAGGSGGGSCIVGGTAGSGAAGMPGLVMVVQR